MCILMTLISSFGLFNHGYSILILVTLFLSLCANMSFAFCFAAVNDTTRTATLLYSFITISKYIEQHYHIHKHIQSYYYYHLILVYIHVCRYIFLIFPPIRCANVSLRACPAFPPHCHRFGAGVLLSAASTGMHGMYTIIYTSTHSNIVYV